jgi:hypothetical protein
MALIVHAQCAYASYSGDQIAWRPQDYKAYKLVKSLKGEPFKGYAEIRDFRGNWHRIEMGSRQAALNCFSTWAFQTLRTHASWPITLVPMPSSTVVDFTDPCPPNDMAEALRSLAPGQIRILRLLKFNRVLQRSREGGSRNPDTLRGHLVMPQAPMAPNWKVVLIDDVKTTGGHIRASAAKLRAAGVQVDTVLVAASTVWAQIPDSFKVEPVDLDPAKVS